MKTDEKITKNEVVALLRDAKWQVKQMKRVNFAKVDVMEMIDDIIKAIIEEKK